MGLNRVVLVLALASLSGCGGGGAQRDTTPASRDCPRLRSEATAAVAAHDACRQSGAGAPVWAHRERYDRALAEVHALQLLASQARVGTTEAQTAADAYWQFLDAVSPELTNHSALDRAEDAAEGILRDREGDPAIAAARTAEEALVEVRRAVLPDEPADPCIDTQASADRAVAAASDCP